MGCVNMTDMPPEVLSRAALGFTFKGSADACSTGNANLATASDPSSVDGRTLHLGDLFLATGQTAAADNGLYVFAATGAELAAGTFDVAGEIEPSSLSPDHSFLWIKGNGTSAVGETTITETGLLKAGASGNITVHGPPSTANTGSLKIVSPVRAPALDASGDFMPGCIVRVLGGTANFGTWQYTGQANPILGVTALPWTKVSTKTDSSVQPPIAPPSFTNTPPGALDPCAVSAP